MCSVHWGINPLLKNTMPSFLPSPPPIKSANYPSPPFLGIPFPPSILAFHKLLPPLPLKVGFFTERPKFQSFSSLTTSYLLKVTEFLVKISQLEFLVMAEKNISVYKLFLSLNISDFSLFVCFFVKLQPPEKSYPFLSSPPLFFENLVGGSTPLPNSRKRGVHTML